MRLFEEKVFLRLLLVLASVFFAAFIPEIVATKDSLLWAVPYFLADFFLVVVAVMYRFPVIGNRKRMREDVEITAPAPAQTPIRDFKKDLMERDELFQMMVDVSSNGFWTFDVVTGKVYWSKRAIKLLQAQASPIQDSFDLLRERIVESDWLRFKEELKLALETGEKFHLIVSLLDNSAEADKLVISGHVQLNEDGHPIRIVGSLDENSDKQAQEKQNYYYVYQDALTGVYNRKFFLEKLKVDVDMALQRPDYLFAVALLDIDRFGAINTSYSINVGDNVLRVVADRIRAQCRVGDTIARIGPDVFAIVLHDIQKNDDSDVKSIVRRIHSAVKQPIQLDGRELYIGVSMAVALNREVDCVEDIMANVTSSLREMKKSVNHGGIQFFSGGIREKAMRLYKLEFDIRKAIQAQEFVLFYQPIVDITDGNRIVAFEALVRWNQSKSKFISPAEFIPIAEETGLIIPLGAQILKMACLQTKKWVDAGFTDIQVAVNFSAKQFALDNMIDDIKQVLLETQLNPKNLKLEITEYTAVCEAEKTVRIMKALSSMGIQISIDDFGTGYSSLSYLKQFPIHTLKMDKSFIDHVTDDEEDASFARMVIGIAKSMNLDLIAEGVESESQLQFLRDEGCRLIQGFYFSKPLSAENARDYLQEHYAPATTAVAEKRKEIPIIERGYVGESYIP
ncbi:diguanylate cyclase (GGDEF) domain-containing protein [Fibrobacter sp. UWB15]|jgi:diguanylate cyclase (GGDEF)-like protein|uniref:putative bifunctional diguanylate cyclase/phosphodiesterase n=1 Tax=unclassified Fibrobacter TaxID=2634177 RepID=UPI000919EC24|nr:MULTISPECIES: EAL domain-containing protein [unclassified Fibrobacter]PWJ65617.1 diguanylate cyclase (GGDEF)-like protein [Fibrobacter sp. UWB6]SHF97670.1 diguanylate cyclase (GGDEF) domain-containing protein [Fibrobacter sp. UWB8]SMG23888.1 diguanylate cyclase (GGDEF) domain-containing protein [Fibrobacter sp. UWB15]